MQEFIWSSILYDKGAKPFNRDFAPFKCPHISYYFFVYLDMDISSSLSQK